MFKSKLFYVKIYKNRIDLIDLNTELTISRQSNRLFSNDQLVLADFSIAAIFLDTLLNEIDSKLSFFSRRKFVIQQFSDTNEQLTEIEKRALIDLAEHSRAITVKVIGQKQELTVTEARAAIIK